MKSRDMLPTDTVYNVMNNRGADSKLPTYGSHAYSSSGIDFSYFFDVIFAQFRRVALLSFSLPSLLHRIFPIVSISSKEQMVGINTSRHVASVKYLKVIRYLPKVNYPRNPVSMFNPPPEPKAPMDIRISFTKPTPFGFYYLFPEPFNSRSFFGTRLSFVGAFLRAVIVLSYSGKKPLEVFTTSSTLKLHLKTFLSDVKRASSYCCWSSPQTITFLP